MTYTFDYRVKDEILFTAKHEFADDLDALQMARRLGERCEIQIWRHERWGQAPISTTRLEDAMIVKSPSPGATVVVSRRSLAQTID